MASGWQPAYVRTAELRSYLDVADGIDDAAMQRAIEAASRTVDREANRQFGKVKAAQTREFEGTWNNRLGVYVVEVDDIQDTTGLMLTVSGSTLATTEYRMWQPNALANGRPYERVHVRRLTPDDLGKGPGTLSVSALWGWSSIPETIKEATLMQASRFFARSDSPFGVAGSPELGNELRLLDKADPDVALMVRSYSRNRPMVR